MKEITPANYVFEKDEQVIEIAKSQPQYRILPAVLVDKNASVSRWQIPLPHRIRILLTGNLYIETKTFGVYEWRERQSAPVYPQYLYTEIRWLGKVANWFEKLGEKYKLNAKHN